MTIRIELVGGPLDGEVIEVAPETNSIFNIERNGQKEWYQTFGGGKAHYCRRRHSNTIEEAKRWL